MSGRRTPILALHSGRANGFTLIEVLTVVALLGVVSLAVAINFSRGDEAILRDESAHLALDIEMAIDAGRYTGRPLVMRIGGTNRYRFLQKSRDDLWGIPDDPALHSERTLAADVSITSIRVGNQSLTQDNPVLLGRMPMLPVVIGLALNGRQVVITASAVGRVAIQ